MTSELNNRSPSVSGRGVYTLANDPVIEWFEAFIRSFRRTHPKMPLTVIPFNNSISQLQRLTAEYDFTIMPEVDCNSFDDFETVVMDQNRSAAMFRKWASFFGPYTDFVFLDSDIIMTSSLDEILDAYAASNYDLLYFDTDMSVVYAPEFASEMATDYGSAGFIAGAFVSRRGMFTRDELREISRRAANDRRKFVINQVDQPFLNYAFDVTGKRKANIDRVLPKFAHSTWARRSFDYDSKRNVAVDSEGKVMPFIHWAGCSYPTMVRPEIFLQHRIDGITGAARMRYEVLFYYRRYRTYFLNAKAHWEKVISLFFTNKAWRKFYLCRLIGIKTKLPT